jgi:hypothetical protein
MDICDSRHRILAIIVRLWVLPVGLQCNGSRPGGEAAGMTAPNLRSLAFDVRYRRLRAPQLCLLPNVDTISTYMLLT